MFAQQNEPFRSSNVKIWGLCRICRCNLLSGGEVPKEGLHDSISHCQDQDRRDACSQHCATHEYFCKAIVFRRIFKSMSPMPHSANVACFVLQAGGADCSMLSERRGRASWSHGQLFARFGAMRSYVSLRHTLLGLDQGMGVSPPVIQACAALVSTAGCCSLHGAGWQVGEHERELRQPSGCRAHRVIHAYRRFLHT